MPARRIIADYIAIHRRRPTGRPVDLMLDRHFFEHARSLFAAAIATAGYDPASIPAPFDDARQPIIAEGDFVPLLDRGVWKTHCPSCGGATILRRGARLHFCYACWDDGEPVWREVAWLPETEAIERVLLQRPQAANRNFYPHQGETLVDLRQQNTEYGVG